MSASIGLLRSRWIAGGLLATAAIALAVLFSPLQATGQAIPYKTNDERAVYAMGILQAKQLRSMLMTDKEIEIFVAGVKDEARGQNKVKFEEELRNIQQFQRTRRQAATEQEKEASRTFLERSAVEPGAEVTGSGLIYTEITPGLGERATIVDTVKVHYHGTLRDGTIFDSSVDRGQAATFRLNGVIPCWTEALQKMKVGGKAKLVCPAEIAYGDRGSGMLIKPGAALAFEVELIEIQK